ncbi:cypD, partial [Symbiodinium pilosum]
IVLAFGSFQKGDCARDVKVVHSEFPKILGLTGYDVNDPVEGNALDFNSLKDAKVLVVCTSSKLGFPPPNLMQFAHHLLTLATTSPGSLSHLRHVVCGNGQEMYEETYMNMPRYMDMLLEKCGSRRFYERGEFGEPHAPTGADACDPKEWSKGMWMALTDTIVADGDGTQWEATAWDGLWAKKPSPVHNKVTEWGRDVLEKQMEKAKIPVPPSSVFAKL